MEIIEILNIILMGLIPITIKLINDIKNLLVLLEKQKTEIKNIKEDTEHLKRCLNELKLKLIK